MNVNRDIYKLSLHMNPAVQQKAEQKISTPDSGRSAGKTAVNPNNVEVKFLNLAKNSIEAEKGGLKYALRDEAVYSGMERAGVSD